MLQTSHDSNHGLPSFAHLICLTQYSPDTEQEHFFDAHSTAVDQDETVDTEADVETETTLQTERLVQCISDCFEEFCLEDRRFDLKRFARLTEAFFGDENRPYCGELKSKDGIKSKVLTCLMRKVFVALSLSKTQMDLLNRFLKGVLILVDPENTPLAQKIHAGYLSCLRDCVQEGHSTDAYIQSCFGACQKFSIALDTALFRQDHVLMCSVRFAFDTTRNDSRCFHGM